MSMNGSMGQRSAKGPCPSVKIPFATRLQALGLDRTDFDLYWDVVVKGRTRHWKKRVTASTLDGWYFVERHGRAIPLDQYKIVKHLAGEYWVAKQIPGITDFFAIDVDTHHCEDIQTRYNALVRVLGPGFPIQSSTSGGIHVYWFLSKPHQASEVADKLSALLHAGGITLVPGWIETFPGTIDHLRLPLGRGSETLARESLQPQGVALKDAIMEFGEYRDGFRLSLDRRFAFLQREGVRIAKWNRDELQKCPETRPRPTFMFADLCGGDTLDVAQVPKDSPVSGADMDLILAALMDGESKQPVNSSPLAPESRHTPPKEMSPTERAGGLVISSPIPAYGSRNELILRAVREQIGRYGRPEKDAAEAIVEWLRRPDFEHISRDWESNPARVEVQVRAAVRNFAKKRRQWSRGPDSAPLSLEDVRCILGWTTDPQGPRRFGRREFSAQRFLFSLLALYRSRQSKELPLPYVQLAKLDGASSHTAKDMIFFCLNNGILTMTREEDPRQHVCRLFRLNHEFRGEAVVPSLADGLHAIFGISGIFANYTRGIYDCLTRS